MVKALCGLLLCALPLRAMPESAPTALAAQDRTASLWGAAEGREGTVFRWKPDGWEALPFPDAKGYLPRAITRGDNGTVYLLWQFRQTDVASPPGDLLVTAHRGSVSRVLGRIPAPGVTGLYDPPPMLWAGASGDVWVANSQTILWHLSPAGKAAPYPLKPEYFRHRQEGESTDTVQTASLVDGQGRRWFWQNGQPWGGRSLAGVLIWDGRKMAYHPRLPGLPDQQFTTLALRDSRHLWVGVFASPLLSRTAASSTGLYSLDTRTLASTLVPPPAKDAFQNVRQIFSAHGLWYAVDKTIYGSQGSSLWRQQGTGWQRCINSLQKPGVYGSAKSALPWQATATGTWLGVTGGAWWMPAKFGPPVFVDRRQGLWMDVLMNLLPLPSGDVLVTGSGAITASILPPSPPPLLSDSRPLLAEPGGLHNGIQFLIADPRRHLWGVDSDWRKEFTLDEWDGDHWHSHPTPNLTQTLTVFWPAIHRPHLADEPNLETRGRAYGRHYYL